MLLSIGGKLGCDLCGKILEREFVYYTARVVKVAVNVAAKQTVRSETDMDVEFCEECRGKMRAVMLFNIEKLKKVKGG